jgi:hypothetical protein
MKMMVATVTNADHTNVLLSVVMETVTVMKLTLVQKIANQVKPVQIVNLIGRLTDLNAVIQHGMSMVLIALHY